MEVALDPIPLDEDGVLIPLLLLPGVELVLEEPYWLCEDWPDCPLALIPDDVELWFWLDRWLPVLEAALDPMPGAFSELPLVALGLFTPLEDWPDFPG